MLSCSMPVLTQGMHYTMQMIFGRSNEDFGAPQPFMQRVG